MQKIILITGIPGVGKSTISSLLKDKLGATHIDISQLVKKNRLYEKIDEKRQSIILDEKKLRRKMLDIVENNPNTLIIDGHSGFYALNPDEITHVFVLRRAPWELVNVLSMRGWPFLKIKENIEAEIIDVSLAEALEIYDTSKICEINTTGKSPITIVEMILEVLHHNKICNYGNIDWISFTETQELIEELNVRSS